MLRFKRRLHKEDAREDRMTTEPADAQAVADLISDVFCECRSIVEADVGRLSGELFLKVMSKGGAFGLRQTRSGSAKVTPKQLFFCSAAR